MTEEAIKNDIVERFGRPAGVAVDALQSIKGEDLALLDVRGRSVVTDFYLLATGGNPPHLKALTNETGRFLKQELGRAVRASGTPESGWTVLDAGDLVVHIFDREKREYYNLEELWNDAERVDIE